MRRFGLLLLVGSIVVAGCSVKLGYDDRSDAEREYSRVWAEGVVEWNAAEPAMSACDTSSGNPDECVKADAAMRVALGHLLDDLDRLAVPSSYADGDVAMKRELRMLVAALTARDASLMAHDTDAFRRSLDLLAAVDLVGAAQRYPRAAGISVDMSD